MINRELEDAKLFKKNFKLNKDLMKILYHSKNKARKMIFSRKKRLLENKKRGKKQLVFMDIKTYDSLKLANDMLYASKLRYSHSKTIKTNRKFKRSETIEEASARRRVKRFRKTRSMEDFEPKKPSFRKLFILNQKQKRLHMKLFEKIYNNLEGQKLNKYLPEKMKVKEERDLSNVVIKDGKVVYKKPEKKRHIPVVKKVRASSVQYSSIRKRLASPLIEKKSVEKQRRMWRINAKKCKAKVKSNMIPNQMHRSRLSRIKAIFEGSSSDRTFN